MPRGSCSRIATKTIADPKLRRSFIYEVNVDGTGLRQLTGTIDDPMTTVDGRRTVLIEDWDPCYLPDGGFAFVSTRNQGGVRCHHGGRYCPTYLLYRADAEGRNIRPMSHGEANEWDPSVLSDGRIIWTRWDYINRHDTIYQSLWTTRPDGTGTAHFYGNYTRNPCNILEARAIPGSRKVVGTAAAHHAYTAGSIIVIDSAQGEDGPAPIERVTPEVAFPETEGYPVGAYATPWPLNEDLFLVAYTSEKLRSQGRKSQKKNAYAIYLVDTLGGARTDLPRPGDELLRSDATGFSPVSSRAAVHAAGERPAGGPCLRAQCPAEHATDSEPGGGSTCRAGVSATCSACAGPWGRAVRGEQGGRGIGSGGQWRLRGVHGSGQRAAALPARGWQRAGGHGHADVRLSAARRDDGLCWLP